MKPARIKFIGGMLVVIVAFTVIFGPILGWDGGNWSGVRPDMSELFSKCGVSISDFDCNLVGLTRQATCNFHASDSQVQKIIQVLKLHKGSTNQEQCPCSPSSSRYLKIYEVNGRPKQLQFRHKQLEFLTLYQNTNSYEVCMYFSYAYG